MKFTFFLLFSCLVSTSNQQNSTKTSTTQPISTTTTLNPWDQAYIEVFGHLPSEFQNSITPTIPETTTTFPIVVDGASPDLTYQLKNGSVIILNNFTSVETSSPSTQSPATQGCRDRARNCAEMREMCNTNLYSNTLADFCSYTCGRCGSCVDRSAKCQFWKQRGYCSSVSFIPQHRGVICQKTCGLC